MNIKEKLILHKYFLLIILVMLIIIIILTISIFTKNSNFSNPYEVKVKDYDNFLFLGDSITDFYPLDEYYDNLPVVNSGISGNRTTDILNDMIKRVYQYNPTKIFILIGTNDLDSNDSDIVDRTYKNIKKIITKIKNNRNRAKIYLESVYPVNKDVDSNAVNNRDNKKIKRLNKKIENYCLSTNNCNYINLYNDLVDANGNLNSKYTTDGLHLNSLGYVVVTRELLPFLSD